MHLNPQLTHHGISLRLSKYIKPITLVTNHSHGPEATTPPLVPDQRGANKIHVLNVGYIYIVLQLADEWLRITNSYNT
jgi:hypothetical protein